jgi:hypothetical protein
MLVGRRCRLARSNHGFRKDSERTGEFKRTVVKAAVDRELAMIELKEKIKKLENKLGEDS